MKALPSRRCLIVIVAAAACGLSGCRAPAVRRAAPQSVTSIVYRPPGEKQLNKRIAELQKAGQPRDVAERKAKQEFAATAWQTDTTDAWAAGRARAERSAQRESMEKALARLPKY